MKKVKGLEFWYGMCKAIKYLMPLWTIMGLIIGILTQSKILVLITCMILIGIIIGYVCADLIDILIERREEDEDNG